MGIFSRVFGSSNPALRELRRTKSLELPLCALFELRRGWGGVRGMRGRLSSFVDELPVTSSVTYKL